MPVRRAPSHHYTLQRDFIDRRYAEAGDLKRQLRKAREKEARFDERVIWKYFSQIVAAVAQMHGKRIMHRDLKPANIFLTINGTIKVGDLGLGRLLSENTLEAHSKVREISVCFVRYIKLK